MSKIYKKPPYCKGNDDHQKYLSRIRKTLYYGRLPKNDVLSLPVTELAVEIFSEAQKGKSLDRLHCNTAAQISRNACVSPCSFILAMIYLERLKTCNVEYLERTSPSDLFLISLMVSSKYLFDDGESDEVFMDEWAASAGMTCKELIRLEKDFLNAIDWKIFVNQLSFWKKLHEIETKLAKKEGTNRGHFTYTEIQTLSSTIEVQNIVQCLVCISMILAATYTAGLLTLVGSVYLASQIPGSSLYRKPIEDTTLVPVTYHKYDKEILTEKYCNDTNIESQKSNGWQSSVIKVFKASILLASIKTSNCNSTESTEEVRENTKITDTCQQVTWDWWNIPIMTWLSRSSEYINALELPTLKNYLYYLENKAVNSKYIYLEDHIHKATKTRIQDQIECSWHAEWTDSIKKYNYYYLLPYLQNIKS
ncbi:protein CNPPD1 [Sitophilus oryzae]|uniref:Protein CNPPD1 n=1 Tax=Sitophilus oryzae TaxID=7048 RepID=A0A6J2XGM1_SITOR|nr:protein CNPPD1 [Sitophilus oryzae]